MPRIVIIPSPVFDRFRHVRAVGEALDGHLDVIIAIDDEWRDLIASSDDEELKLKLKMAVLDGISGCISGVGGACPAVVLHRSDVELLWLADDGSVRPLSMKEIVRRRELLYAVTVEPPEGVRLFRLQTYRPLEPGHRPFFDDQFENLELEMYEALYGSPDVERWRRLARATTLPRITEVISRAVKRFIMELCVFDEYNVCPGILLLNHGDRVDMKILKMTSKPDYVTRIDLAGLLADR